MSVQLAEWRSGGMARKTRKTRNDGGISYVWCTDDELDVRWYFCDAPGRAGGLHSNLAAQIEAIRLGAARVTTVVDAEDAMAQRVDDSRRATRVRRLLVAVGPRHCAVLSAHLGGEAPPRAVRERWGERAAVVLALDPQAARHTKGPRGEQLDEAAVGALRDAQAAYAQARAEARHR